MQKLKAWIAAARLRTLPLSVSGIILGSSLATSNFYQTSIFWFAILVTIGFQVLSNFANDYGDGIRGTDANREGEQRMVAAGLISPKQMKYGMIAVGAITFFFATILIFLAFGNENTILSFVFFNLTLISIIAAVKYTVGKKAYGYSGFGDVFVFLFFGLLAVLGTYFLFEKEVWPWSLLPAITIGCFSVAVLNLNNMRDINSDTKAGKRTLVVKMGLKNAKKYHISLLLIGMFSALFFAFKTALSLQSFAFVIAFVPLVFNMIFVAKNTEPQKFDGELKKVALSTFLFAILFAIF